MACDLLVPRTTCASCLPAAPSAPRSTAARAGICRACLVAPGVGRALSQLRRSMRARRWRWGWPAKWCRLRDWPPPVVSWPKDWRPGPAAAQAGIKRLLRAAVDRDLPSALEAERERFLECVMQPDFAEGVRAFAAGARHVSGFSTEAVPTGNPKSQNGFSTQAGATRDPRTGAPFADREIARARQKRPQQALPRRVHERARALACSVSTSAEAAGGGIGCMELVLVTEAFCRGCLGIGTALCVNALAARRSSSPAARRSAAAIWAVRPRGAGQLRAHQPGAGSDMASIRTRAERVQDICAHRQQIVDLNANLAGSSSFSPRPTRPQARGSGMTAFIDAARQRPGVGDRWASSAERRPTAEVFLENVFVPEDHRTWARRAAALRWRCRPSTLAADGRPPSA